MVLPLVEPATGDAADLTLVCAIMADAFDPQYGEAWTPSQVTGILALPGVWLTLARIDGEGAGFALTRAIVGEAELLLFAVRRDYRRRGVGTTLLGTVEGECRTRGVSRLHLEVRSNNAAVMLYRSAGFVMVGSRRDYYRGAGGQRFDANTYAHDLD